MNGPRLHRWLLGSATLLALLVVVLGAYVRLSEAGLSCPDWPGCYGEPTVAAALAHARQIDTQYPDRPLHPAKARKEMVHRYAAATLGLLVVLIALHAWRSGRALLLPLLLLVLIVAQALLGMWTVTLQLKPLVVTAHLVGGMGITALLWWLWLGMAPSRAVGGGPLRPAAIIGLLLLAAQITLGGWTSSHYAGLACNGFPACNGEWWPALDLAAGFGERPLDGTGLITIQWLHRLGALTVTLYFGWLALRCRRAAPALHGISAAIGLLLVLQVAIGTGNVLAGLPLPLAAAHNAVAALLLLSVVTLNQRLASASRLNVPGGAP